MVPKSLLKQGGCAEKKSYSCGKGNIEGFRKQGLSAREGAERVRFEHDSKTTLNSLAELRKRNTEIEISRGNIVFSKLLVNRLVFKIIDAIVSDRYFGLWDTRGILHPKPNATQWNWSRRGLYLTCFYREPRNRGLADILVKCTSQESFERIEGVLA